MKNEKFLHMLGEIDERHLREANADVELWLEERNGIKVPTERPQKTPWWKIATAAACSAAAVLGAFVVAKNVTKLENLGNTSYSEGESAYADSETADPNSLFIHLDNYTIENLDYENAVITEGTPASGQWQSFTFETPTINEKSADRLVKLAADYGVTINKDDMMVLADSVIGRNNSSEFILLPKVDFAKYEDLQYEMNDYPYHRLHYKSDDFYIETAVPGIGYVELNNNKNISSVLDKDMYYTGAWRPSFDEVFKDVVKTWDEEKTCVLNGKTVKVADAVRNAQKIISESDMFPKGFSTKINNITLYTYPNGNQVLDLSFMYTFDGVAFVSPMYNNYVDIKISNVTYPIRLHCAMVTDNSLDWVILEYIDGETEFAINDCDITVSREDALKIVSQRLDPDGMYEVKEIRLLYGLRYSPDRKTRYIEPTWQFFITDNKHWKPYQTNVYVSAVDSSANVLDADQYPSVFF